MISYIKADLVTGIKDDADVYKLHACNCLGKWGRGIAAAFRDHYPRDYKEYQKNCTENMSRFGDSSANLQTKVLGKSFITSNNIICLMTSLSYYPPDPAARIISSTSKALSDLGFKLPNTDIHIYSNRFNSGLFHVPWEQTEALVEEFLKNYSNIKWTVCDL